MLLAVLLGTSLVVRLVRLDAPSVPVFDEGVFYLPAARSYLAGLPDPNFEHPPLGKLSIAAGMAVLGDTPWGWRLSAALAGTLGIFLTYRLAWLLWASQRRALLAAGLLALDFLWLVFSRLALLDIFVATLVVAALGFAWSYRLSLRDRDLVATGLTLGLAAAVKWSGAWALVPVAVALAPTGGYQGWLRAALRRGTLVLSAATLGYLLPWLYQLVVLGVSPERLASLHVAMWRYQTEAGVAEASSWERLTAPLLWLLNLPLLFISDADRTAWVLVMSNPFTFWPGLVAAGWLARRSVGSLRGPEAFLLAAVLTFYLPWFAIARLKYFYYLLPALPLLAVALAGLLDHVYLLGHGASPLQGKRRRVALTAYLAITAAVFLGTYPALTGVWSR